jgi:hypothetical protein
MAAQAPLGAIDIDKQSLFKFCNLLHLFQDVSQIVILLIPCNNVLADFGSM